MAPPILRLGPLQCDTLAVDISLQRWCNKVISTNQSNQGHKKKPEVTSLLSMNQDIPGHTRTYQDIQAADNYLLKVVINSNLVVRKDSISSCWAYYRTWGPSHWRVWPASRWECQVCLGVALCNHNANAKIGLFGFLPYCEILRSRNLSLRHKSNVSAYFTLCNL